MIILVSRELNECPQKRERPIHGGGWYFRLFRINDRMQIVVADFNRLHFRLKRLGFLGADTSEQQKVVARVDRLGGVQLFNKFAARNWRLVSLGEPATERLERPYFFVA